jgi:dihydroorotase
VAVKGYLADKNGQGGTTHSTQGVKDLEGRYPVFEVMEKHGIPYLGHFEAVEEEVDEFDREVVSRDRDLEPMVETFPGLNIVVEHVTDGRMADFVAETRDGVYATVTPQGLMLNRNAMFRGGMNPDEYCRPVPKREEHRCRVREYVMTGNPRFGAGTDSAPHQEYPDPNHPEDPAKARSHGCAAGIFTAIDAVELYATEFDKDNALDHFEPFMSVNFLHVYGMQPSQEMMVIENSPYEVPKTVGSVQVFRGGTTLPWHLIG